MLADTSCPRGPTRVINGVQVQSLVDRSRRNGGAFADALAEAAERGVAVHAIFDFLGSVRADSDKFRRMEEAGVEVVRWREPSWYQLSRFNNRTHRKLLIVDGEIGFTGGARDSIRLATPYFYPDDMILDALLDARDRGVSVDLMHPAEGDYSAAVREASRNRWRPLLEAGVQIHEYQPSKYHAKLYIIDEYWVSIGSSNLDNRSFRLNDETNVVIMDSDLAATLTAQYRRDLEQTETYDLSAWENRPHMRRLLGWLAMTVGWHL